MDDAIKNLVEASVYLDSVMSLIQDDKTRLMYELDSSGYNSILTVLSNVIHLMSEQCRVIEVERNRRKLAKRLEQEDSNE